MLGEADDQEKKDGLGKGDYDHLVPGVTEADEQDVGETASHVEEQPERGLQHQSTIIPAQS